MIFINEYFDLLLYKVLHSYWIMSSFFIGQEKN